MKRTTFNSLVYFLFILLFVGAFASMARNSYGTDLIGLSCIGFALVFLSDSLIVLFEDKSRINPMRSLENILLAGLSVLFALRVFYIRFDGIELVVSAVGFVLALIYIFRRTSLKETGKRAILSSVYLLSIVFFFLTMGFAPILPSISEIIGVIGFVSLMGILIFSLVSPQLEQENNDGLSKSIEYLLSLGRNGGVVAIAFILISGYVGLTDLGVLPELYTTEKPQKYIEMVKSAEEGNEEKEDGLYRYEKYAREMNTFLKKHGQ